MSPKCPPFSFTLGRVRERLTYNKENAYTFESLSLIVSLNNLRTATLFTYLFEALIIDKMTSSSPTIILAATAGILGSAWNSGT